MLKDLFNIDKKDRDNFCEHIIETSAPSSDFYFLVIISTLIVALGLAIENIALVIGGMLVTPLLSPVLAMALGIVINSPKLLRRSLKTFLVAFVLAFLVAFGVGFLDGVEVSDIYLIGLMKPSFFTLFISFVAGLAAAYTWVKPNINETLPGISITVTLIPPLTSIGMAVADSDWAISMDAFKVLLLNVFGIVITSIVVFSLMDFYRAKKTIDKEIKQEEEKKIKKAKKQTKDELKKIEEEKKAKVEEIETKHKKQIEEAQEKIKKEQERIAKEKEILEKEKEDISEEEEEVKWRD